MFTWPHKNKLLRCLSIYDLHGWRFVGILAIISAVFTNRYTQTHPLFHHISAEETRADPFSVPSGLTATGANQTSGSSPKPNQWFRVADYLWCVGSSGRYADGSKQSPHSQRKSQIFSVCRLTHENRPFLWVLNEPQWKQNPGKCRGRCWQVWAGSEHAGNKSRERLKDPLFKLI